MQLHQAMATILINEAKFAPNSAQGDTRMLPFQNIQLVKKTVCLPMFR